MRDAQVPVFLSSFMISLAVNGAVLYSVDRTTEVNQRRLIRQIVMEAAAKKDPLSFEFVEAPPKTYPQKPRNSRKIAARDALNQDLIKDKSHSADAPLMKASGLADQLAQRQGSASQAPIPKIEPVQASSGSSAQKAQERPKQIKASDPGEKRSEQEPPVRMVAEPKTESEVKPAQKPQEAQPAVPGLTGADKITTQAMSRKASHGAGLFGVTSFEATGSGMGQYMKNIKERIWLAWFPYLAFQYPQDYHGADAVLSLTIDATGELKFVKVLENDGDALFASYCVEAVQKASGFGALPAEIKALIGKDELEIKFGFHYR